MYKKQIVCDTHVLAPSRGCGVVLWLACVTNQISGASSLLPAQWVCLSLSSSLDRSSQQAEKNKSHSVWREAERLFQIVSPH